MKHLIICLVVVLMSSCTNIYFTQLQPKDGIRLKYIPEELQGCWQDSNRTKIFTPNSYISIYPITDSSGKFLGIQHDTINLSDTCVLLQDGDYFVFNVMLNYHKWNICVVEIEKNGDIVGYVPNNRPFPKSDRNLRIDSIKPKAGNQPPSNRVLRKREKESIDEIHYSGFLTHKDIHKITTKENEYFYLSNDTRIPTTK